MEHYRNKILIMTCLFYGAVVGIVVNTNGQFYQSLADALRVPVGEVTLASVIMGIAGLIFTPIVTKWYLKHDARVISVIAALVFMLAHFLCGLVTALWQFYLLSAVRGAVQGFLMFYLVSTVIKAWFKEQSGSKLGIAALSSGIAGMAANTAIGLSIDRWGWRAALCGSALVALILGVPLLWLYMVRSPQEWEEKQGRKVRRPSGSENENGSGGASASAGARTERMTFREAKGKTALLACAVVMTMLWLMPFSLTQHLKIYAMGQGFSQMFGATLITLTMVGNLASKLFLSVYADKLGAKRMTVGVMTLLLTGYVCLLLPASAVSLSAGAVLLGVSATVTSIIVPQVTALVYTGERFNAVFALFSMVMSMGNSVWISIDGLLYSLFGSYIPLFAGGAVLLVISMILFWIFTGNAEKQ